MLQWLVVNLDNNIIGSHLKLKWVEFLLAFSLGSLCYDSGHNMCSCQYLHYESVFSICMPFCDKNRRWHPELFPTALKELGIDILLPKPTHLYVGHRGMEFSTSRHIKLKVLRW